MVKDDYLDLSLNKKFFVLMTNEKIPFLKKIGKMDYLIRIGADVNAKLYGKSMAFWAKELNDEKLVEYIKEKGGVESQISSEEALRLGEELWDRRGEVKSIDEIKELAFKGANLSVKNGKYKQIWQYLSIDEINIILEDLPKGYVIDGDVDLSQGMNLYKMIFRELPDFSKIKIGGSFDCSSGYLRTLKGAPMEVKGNFDCHDNDLVSLNGAPREVGGDFDCHDNKGVTSLVGTPQIVKGVFDCSATGIVSLKGGPSEVKEDMICSFNGNMVSLEGGPKRVGRHFCCQYNDKLVSLKGAPEEVGGDFNCTRNKLLSNLIGSPKKVGKYFACGFNDNLSSLEGASESVGTHFSCSNNKKLRSLKGAPEEVGGDFYCLENNLMSLEGMPLKIGGKFYIEKEKLVMIDVANKIKKLGALGKKMFLGNKEM